MSTRPAPQRRPAQRRPPLPRRRWLPPTRSARLDEAQSAHARLARAERKLARHERYTAGLYKEHARTDPRDPHARTIAIEIKSATMQLARAREHYRAAIEHAIALTQAAYR